MKPCKPTGTNLITRKVTETKPFNLRTVKPLVWSIHPPRKGYANPLVSFV